MKIKRIIEIVDTRQYEEVNDRYQPIPGSGELNICDRCGRTHEVHAKVLLEDDTTAVVGTGCMNAESTEIQSRVKSIFSATKTLKKLYAELDSVHHKLNTIAKSNSKIELYVSDLPYPEIVKKLPSETEWYQHAKGMVLFMENTAEVCCHGGQYDYRVECLKKSWTVAKQRELGWQDTSNLRYLADRLFDMIDRGNKKIKKLLSE